MLLPCCRRALWAPRAPRLSGSLPCPAGCYGIRPELVNEGWTCSRCTAHAWTAVTPPASWVVLWEPLRPGDGGSWARDPGDLRLAASPPLVSVSSTWTAQGWSPRLVPSAAAGWNWQDCGPQGREAAPCAPSPWGRLVPTGVLPLQPPGRSPADDDRPEVGGRGPSWVCGLGPRGMQGGPGGAAGPECPLRSCKPAGAVRGSQGPGVGSLPNPDPSLPPQVDPRDLRHCCPRSALPERDGAPPRGHQRHP